MADLKTKKILLITGGPVKKLDSFIEPAKKLGLDVTLASFYDVNFSSKSKSYSLKSGKTDVVNFDVVYIRMVGKRLEEATLLVSYLRQKKIAVVDRVYANPTFIPSTISKAAELARLIEKGVPIPATVFGSLFYLRDQAPKLFGFPVVIKGTQGKKARDVWAPRDAEELEKLIFELRKREIEGESFFAQEFVKAAQRLRVLTVGGKAIAAITRPTKWRKRFVAKVGDDYPEGVKESLKVIPGDVARLAVQAADAVSLDIAGVDILVEDKSGKKLVIEANAAPSWNLVKKDTGLEVEEEILKFVAGKK